MHLRERSLLVHSGVHNCMCAYAAAGIRQAGVVLEVPDPCGVCQAKFGDDLLADISACTELRPGSANKYLHVEG